MSELRVTADKAGIASKVNPAQKAVKDITKEVENLTGKKGGKTGLEGANTALKEMGGHLKSLASGFKDVFKDANKDATNFFKDANAQAEKLVNKLRTAKNLFTAMGPGAGMAGGGSSPGTTTFTYGPGWGGTAPTGYNPYTPTGGGGGAGGGGAGGGGGGGGGGNNNPNSPGGGTWEPPKWLKYAGVAAATARGVANVFGVYADTPLKELRNNAMRASLGGDLRAGLVGGDLKSLVALSDPRNAGLFSDIGGRTKWASRLNSGADVLVGGTKVAGSIAGGYAMLAGGAMGAAANTVNTATQGGLVAIGPQGLAQGYNGITDFTTGQAQADSANAVKQAIQLRQADNPILMQTLDELSQNGANRARSYRLYSSKGHGTGLTDEQFGEAEFKQLFKDVAKYGVGLEEFANTQARLSGTVGASRGNMLINPTLASEVAWGVSRESAGTTLGAMALGGKGDVASKLDELIARGFTKGIKESKFKEDIMAFVTEHATAGGQTAEAAMMLARMIQDTAGPNATAWDIQTSVQGAQGLSQTWNGANAVMSNLDQHYIANAVGPHKGGAPGDQTPYIALNNATPEQLLELAKGGGDPMLRLVLEQKYGLDASQAAAAAARAKTGNRFDSAGHISTGERVIKKWGGEAALLRKYDAGDKNAIADVAQIGMAMSQSGAFGMSASTPAEVATKTAYKMLRVGSVGGYFTSEDMSSHGAFSAQRTEQDRLAKEGNGGTSAGIAAATTAKALIDVLEQAGKPDVLEAVSRANSTVEQASKLFQGLAKFNVDVASEIDKVAKSIENLGRTAAIYNGTPIPTQGGIGYQLPTSPTTVTTGPISTLK